MESPKEELISENFLKTVLISYIPNMVGVPINRNTGI